MKKQRTQKCVIVIGRNRRVYARLYKMDKFIPAFIKNCWEKEKDKAFAEGFSPCSIKVYYPDETTIKYVIHYETV